MSDISQNAIIFSKGIGTIFFNQILIDVCENVKIHTHFIKYKSYILILIFYIMSIENQEKVKISYINLLEQNDVHEF